MQDESPATRSMLELVSTLTGYGKTLVYQPVPTTACAKSARIVGQFACIATATVHVLGYIPALSVLLRFPLRRKLIPSAYHRITLQTTVICCTSAYLLMTFCYTLLFMSA